MAVHDLRCLRVEHDGTWGRNCSGHVKARKYRCSRGSTESRKAKGIGVASVVASRGTRHKGLVQLCEPALYRGWCKARESVTALRIGVAGEANSDLQQCSVIGAPALKKTRGAMLWTVSQVTNSKPGRGSCWEG